MTDPDGFLDLLEQDAVWVVRDGTRVSVNRMTVRHKRNLLAYFERNADRIKLLAELRRLAFASDLRQLAFANDAVFGMRGEAAAGACDDATRESETPALEWLAEQPLVKRLRADLAAAA